MPVIDRHFVQAKLPRPSREDHKYSRGYALIFAAREMTGASVLAASACARIGCGLVRVLCDASVYDLYRSILPAHIITTCDLDYFDDRVTAVLQGPGGLARELKVFPDMAQVFDADALAHVPERLSPLSVLTPHEGEFEKRFASLHGDRQERARAAAKHLNAIIVLKGHHTVIAHPDGRYRINENASPYLATAGSGDVLAGMITGLLSQGMDPFEAACVGVWIHGQIGIEAGPGLVASDMPDLIATVLRALG